MEFEEKMLLELERLKFKQKTDCFVGEGREANQA